MVSTYKIRKCEGSNPSCTVTSRVANGWSRGCKAASPVRAWMSVVFPGGKRVKLWHCQPPNHVPYPPLCAPPSSPQLVYPTTDTTGNSRRTRSLRISLRLSRSRSRTRRSRSSRSLSARARSSVGDSPGRTSDRVGGCREEPSTETSESSVEHEYHILGGSCLTSPQTGHATADPLMGDYTSCSLKDTQ